MTTAEKHWKISKTCQWIACVIAGVLILLNAFTMEVPESVNVTGFSAVSFFLLGYAVFWIEDKPEPQKKYPEVDKPTPGFEFLKQEDKEWFWKQFHLFDGYAEDLVPEPHPAGQSGRALRQHHDVGEPFDHEHARLQVWQAVGSPMNDGKVDWSKVPTLVPELTPEHVDLLRGLLGPEQRLIQSITEEVKPIVEQLMEVNEREWKMNPPHDYWFGYTDGM